MDEPENRDCRRDEISVGKWIRIRGKIIKTLKKKRGLDYDFSFRDRN